MKPALLSILAVSAFALLSGCETTQRTTTTTTRESSTTQPVVGVSQTRTISSY